MTDRSTLFTRRVGVIALGLAVTAVLLWWVLRGVDLAEVWAAFLTADHRWLAVSVLAVVGTVAVRALRWHLLLIAAVPRASLRSTALATMLGQGANNALPAHGGELARAVAIARLDRISGATALGSIGVERALDLVTVATMLVAAVLARPLSSGASASPVRILLIAVGTVAVLVGLLLVATRQAARIAAVASAAAVKLLGHRAGARLGAGITAGLAGMTVIDTRRRLAQATAMSVLLWLLNAMALLCGMVAFDIQAPASAAFVLQAVLVVGIILPAAPGFFGPFEAAAVLALGWYGVSSQEAVGYILPLHIVAYFVPVLTMGTIAWILTGVRLTDVAGQPPPEPAGTPR